MEISIFLVAWYVSGVALSVYWWTARLDLELEDLVVVLICGGMLGPLMIVAVILDAAEKAGIGKRIIIKKRGK